MVHRYSRLRWGRLFAGPEQSMYVELFVLSDHL